MAIMAQCPICHQKRSNKLKKCPCGEDLDKAKRSKRVQYHLCYRVNGKQIWEPVGSSITEAWELEAERKQQKRKGKITEFFSTRKITFNELTNWYLGLEKVKALASYWLIELTLQKFNSVFGDMIVGDLKPADLENYQQKRITQGKSPATIDHEIGKPRTMIIKAYDNSMVSHDVVRVFKKAKKLLKKGTDVRDRVLNVDEFQALVRECPHHVADIVKVGYYSGMRRNEILKLTWDRVDMKVRVIRLRPEDTKSGKGRTVPMCNELYNVFKNIPRPIHGGYVFLYKGKPVSDIRAGLKTGCKGAGIIYGRFADGGFVFHDLRHSFVTNLRKAGVPESVIMEITGHTTREMFDRYNNIDGNDTRTAIDQLGEYLKKAV